MKNILKPFLAAILLAGVVSCDEDQDLKFVTPPASFKILTPQSGEAVVLNPAMTANPGLVLAWEDVDYSTATTVTYTVEVAKNGTSFAEPIAVATTTNTYISITAGDLNNAALEADLPPFTPTGLDVRIKASVGAPATMETYSNEITYVVTAFSNELPKLAVVGNHQGWTPTAPDVPLLASPGYGQTNYEGYVWLDGGFKILAPNAEGEFNWTSAGGGVEYGGGAPGELIAGGGTDITAAPGYYLVRANTALGTYSITPTNWGLIGSATPNGWDSDQNMTYNQTTKKWTITLNLVGGQEMKFRANDDWGLNYGDTGNDGSLNEGGDNIPVANSGMQTVTLDLSTPRMYTYSISQ